MNATMLELQNLLRQRKTVIEVFFLTMYPSTFSGIASTADAEQIWDHTVFSHLLTAVQERFFRVEEQGTQETRSDAQHVALLIREMGIHANARRMVIKRLHAHGHFDPISYRAARVDRFISTATKPIRPEPDEVFPKVRAIIARIQTQYAARFVDAGSDTERVLRQLRHEMAVEFVREGICRNLGNAQPVVKAITRKERKHIAPLLHSLLKRGLFDRLPHTRYIRPDFATIFREVVETLSRQTDTDRCVAALLTKELCFSRIHAHAVADAYAQRATGSLRRVIRQCWREGHFDHPPVPPTLVRGVRRPVLKDVVEYLETLWQNGTEPITAEVLGSAGICRGHDAAVSVALALDDTNPQSEIRQAERALAFGVMQAYAELGEIGLTYASILPEAPLLMAIQRFLRRRHLDADAILASTLYCDLRALWAAFEHSVPQKLTWLAQLLFYPVLSERRTTIQEQLPAHFQAQCIEHLVTQDGYTFPDGENLTILLLRGGLHAILDWRRGVSFSEAGTTAEQLRIRQLIDHHLKALPAAVRDEIERLALCLRTAAHETKTPLSLNRIIGDQPFNAYRRGLKRRLPVGYGAVHHYRRLAAQQRRAVRRGARALTHHRARLRQSPAAAAGALLVAAFARIAGLEIADAATRLYYVWTYGGIGFIERDRWTVLIDSQLLSLLFRYKLIRIDGRLYLGQARSQLNRYADIRQHEHLSMQICRALLSCYSKPARWNIGVSERITTVRTSAGLVLPGTPWLHRVWRLFYFQLHVPVVASQYSPASDTCHLLLHFDLGSQLPPGCWVSADVPGLREIKLSLFHAFWHPGALDWPLRGAPEVLQVPGELLHNNAEIRDLGDALAWSLANVQIVKLKTQEKLLNQLDTAARIQEDLIHVGLEAMRHRMKNVPQTVKDVQDGVVAWLRNSPVCYEHHQPGEQVTARLSGYAAPAWETPAAGLLLPTVGEVRTVRNGVLVGDNRYIAEGVDWKPGSLMTYRAFPYIYGGAHPEERMAEAIFVGHGDDLTFLTREREH